MEPESNSLLGLEIPIRNLRRKQIHFFRLMMDLNNSTCLPLIMKTIKDLSQTMKNFSICNKSSNASNLIDLYSFWVILSTLINNQCEKPCKSIEYKGELKKYEGWGGITGLIINMYFPTNEINVQEEYLLYEAVDLVGIVGGNLGLFIGFSFIGLVTKFFSMLNDHVLN